MGQDDSATPWHLWHLWHPCPHGTCGTHGTYGTLFRGDGLSPHPGSASLRGAATGAKGSTTSGYQFLTGLRPVG